MFKGVEFAYPMFFWAFSIMPMLIFWYVYRHRKQFVEMKLSSTSSLGLSSSPRGKLRHLLFVFRLAAMSLLIIALARPQTSSKEEKIKTEGIDLVMVMDVSGSMLAEDFKPNRIEAAKRLGLEFVSGRPDDRIGLVVFAGESFTQCPITTDQVVLKNLMAEIKSGLIEDGTAIGMGLATAVNRLKESEAKSKVVILLTDGMNNAGFIAPLTAAEIAMKFNIRTYTIGIGTHGTAPYPIQMPYGVQYQEIEVNIDEELLQQVAQMTNGKYFRATGNQQLEKIYEEIDQMEKTLIDRFVIQRHSEEFLTYAFFAGLLLVSEIFLKNTIFRSLT